LGSIFTPAATARSLAGASTIFGAERTEINADVFQQQAIQVVTNAFDQRRRRMLNVMACHATEGLSTYTLERAVAQAFKYHAACSLVAGLEEANKDTTQGSDIGLAAAHQTMQTIALIYEDTHGGKNGPFNAPATSSGLSPTVSNSTPTPTPVCQTLLATEDTPSEATSLAAMTPYEIANSAKLTAQSKTDAFHTTVSAALSTAQGISSDADLAKDLTTLSKQIDTSLGQFKSAADRWYAGQAQLTGQIEIASLRYDSATGATGATDALNAQKDFYTAQSTALSVSNNLSGASIVGVNLELANFNSAVSAAMSDGGALLSTSAALSATQDLQAYCPGTSYVRPTPGNPAQACPAKTSWLDGSPARGVALARAGDFVTTGAAGIPDRAMTAARLASAPIAASTSAAADRNDSSLPPVAAAATPFPPRRRLVAVLASSASPPDWLDRPPDRVAIQ